MLAPAAPAANGPKAPAPGAGGLTAPRPHARAAAHSSLRGPSMNRVATSLPAVLAAALALGLAGPAPAQDQGTPPAAPSIDDLSLGEEVTENGTYLAGTYGDWQLICQRAEQGVDPCLLQQPLRDAEGNMVAEFNLFALPPGREVAAGANIVTPLLTLLTQQVTIRVDNGTARRYPFTWCEPIGCVARVGFTAAEVTAFKRGRAATITIVPVAAPDQPVNLTLSLTGFTAGHDAAVAALTTSPRPQP